MLLPAWKSDEDAVKKTSSDVTMEEGVTPMHVSPSLHARPPSSSLHARPPPSNMIARPPSSSFHGQPPSPSIHARPPAEMPNASSRPTYPPANARPPPRSPAFSRPVSSIYGRPPLGPPIHSRPPLGSPSYSRPPLGSPIHSGPPSGPSTHTGPPPGPSIHPRPPPPSMYARLSSSGLPGRPPFLPVPARPPPHGHVRPATAPFMGGRPFGVNDRSPGMTERPAGMHGRPSHDTHGRLQPSMHVAPIMLTDAAGNPVGMNLGMTGRPGVAVERAPKGGTTNGDNEKNLKYSQNANEASEDEEEDAEDVIDKDVKVVLTKDKTVEKMLSRMKDSGEEESEEEEEEEIEEEDDEEEEDDDEEDDEDEDNDTEVQQQTKKPEVVFSSKHIEEEEEEEEEEEPETLEDEEEELVAQSDINDLTCQDCGKDFDTERGLLVHRVRKHPEITREQDGGGGTNNNSGILNCDQCGKEFTKNRALQEHIDGEHLMKRFKCTMKNCPTKCKWRPDILKHMKEKHKMRMTMNEALNRGIVLFEPLTDEEIAEEIARKAARYKTPKKKKTGDGGVSSPRSGGGYLSQPEILGHRAARDRPVTKFASPMFGGHNASSASPKKAGGLVSPKKFQHYERNAEGLLTCHLCEFTTKYNSNLRRHEKFAHNNFKSKKMQRLMAMAGGGGGGGGGMMAMGAPGVRLAKPAPIVAMNGHAHGILPLKPHHSVNHQLSNGGPGDANLLKLEGSSGPNEDSLYHVLVVTIKGEKMYQCSACETVSPRADTIRIHINAIHKQIRYRCVICNDYTTKYMTSFRGHVQNIHQLFDSCRQYAFEYSELNPPDFDRMLAQDPNMMAMMGGQVDAYASQFVQQPSSSSRDGYPPLRHFDDFFDSDSQNSYHQQPHQGFSHHPDEQQQQQQQLQQQQQEFREGIDYDDDEGRSVYTPNQYMDNSHRYYNNNVELSSSSRDGCDDMDLSSSSSSDRRHRHLLMNGALKKPSLILDDPLLNPFLQEMAPMSSPSAATPVQPSSLDADDPFSLKISGIDIGVPMPGALASSFMASIVPTSALSAAVTSSSSAASATAAPTADYFISALSSQSTNKLVPLRSVDPTDLKNPDSPDVATRSIGGGSRSARIDEDDEGSEVGSGEGSESGKEDKRADRGDSEVTEATRKSSEALVGFGKENFPAHSQLSNKDALQHTGLDKKSMEIKFDAEKQQQPDKSEDKSDDNGERAKVAEMDTETKIVGNVVIATVGGGGGAGAKEEVKKNGVESAVLTTKELGFMKKLGPTKEGVVSVKGEGVSTLMEVDGVQKEVAKKEVEEKKEEV